MTVKIYVPKDSTGKEWGLDLSHEMEGVIEVLQKLWAAYNHLPQFYAVIVNLRQPSADFVLISERGLGVLDLKHSYGRIRIQPNGLWSSGGVQVKGGNNNPTPQMQVHSYAKEIRSKILFEILPPWLKPDKDQWDKFKFQTAVCFTNHQAELDELINQAKIHPTIYRFDWEDNFSVFSPDGIVPWAAQLRFGINYGRERKFEPYKLHPTFISSRIVTNIFGAVEWKEILPSMPTGEPYAYIHRKDSDGEATYKLVKDNILIGRNPDCDISVPNAMRVSRRHCQIVRHLHGIELEDLGSSHGTYINGELIEGKVLLINNQEIILGGATLGEKTCLLRYESREQVSIKPSSTERSNEHI